MVFNMIDNARDWRAALGAFPRFESYHTWDFTMIEARRGDCRAFALTVEEGGEALFLPLLEREIPGSGRKDLTSVYGYPGPLYRGAGPGFARLWQGALHWLREMRYVSMFSRCSPVFTENMEKLPAEFCRTSRIVTVDLTLPESEQWKRYRRNHRADVLRARSAGMRVERSDADAGEFLRLYHATMDKVGASAYYYYDAGYIEALLRARDFETRLYVCRHEGGVAAATLVLFCGDIAQYHLCGADRPLLKLGTAKLLIDTVRREAAEEGCTRLVLGGSSDGDDSLLCFKAGFSKDTADFHVIKCVLDRQAYDALSAASAVDCGGHFPAYRTPARIFARNAC